MKTIRRFASNPLVLLLLVSAFLYTSCTSSSEISKDENQLLNEHVYRAASTYSGEEIFKAIYFLEGDFVNEMSYLKQNRQEMDQYVLKPGEQDEKDRFVKNIITEIKNAEPSYFEDFKRSLRSENLYELKEIYKIGLTKIEKAAKVTDEYELGFLMAQAFMEKGVDFDREDINALDLSTPEGLADFKEILKKDYNLDFDSELAGRKAIICNFGIACVVALVVVATMALVAQSVGGLWVYWVYAKVKFWGKSLQAREVEDDAFVLELSELFS